MIELIRADHLDDGLRLSTAAGWNQTRKDWQRIITLEPSGCFCARDNGQVIGTVTTHCYQRTAWIGLMLVDAGWRGQGVGRALMQRALDYLASTSITSIRLDATSMGEPLYSSLGFRHQFSLHRYAGHPRAGNGEPRVRQVAFADLSNISTLDRQVVQDQRSRFLESLLIDAPNCGLVSPGVDGIRGYVLWRPGRLAWMVGPCIAKEIADARHLIDTALTKINCRDVFMDVPDDNRAAVAMMREMEFAPRRKLLRMIRGDEVVESIAELFASSGPELG